jgi:hypothetical protein
LAGVDAGGPRSLQGIHPKHRKRFCNAVGSFGSYYPAEVHRVLRENDDAFSSRHREPLVPTAARFVYANRFRSGEKLLYTLYNATGHTFAGREDGDSPLRTTPLAKSNCPAPGQGVIIYGVGETARRVFPESVD